jgi:DNA-directed RNA polymerase beta' subunit
MAFKPRLTKESSIRMSPLVVKGLGMDFDGDQSNFHVPVEEEAVQEALEKLLPSKNLISPADFCKPGSSAWSRICRRLALGNAKTK